MRCSGARAGVASRTVTVSGIVRGVPPTRADDARRRVVRERAERVAGRGELVGGRAGEVERVADDREDIGVLQQQRAPAGGLERMAEAVDDVAVAIGDRADRADADGAGGETDGERRAGHERLRRERAERPCRSGDDRAAVRARRALAAAARARARGPTSSAAKRARWPRAAASARGARRSAASRQREHLLDRRHEPDVLAVLADRRGDRAGVADRAVRVRAVDGRAGEALGDPGRGDRRARHAHEDPRAAAELSATTSSTSTSKSLIVVPWTTVRAVHCRPR